MKIHRNARVALAALATAAISAPAALGAGEQKNEPPFARPLPSVTTPSYAVSLTSAAATRVGAGEAKNQHPFTARFSADPELAVALLEIAQGRVDPPPPPSERTRIVPVFVDSGGGFSWLDASLGASAALGICALGAGAFLRFGTRFRSGVVTRSTDVAEPRRALTSGYHGGSR